MKSTLFPVIAYAILMMAHISSAQADSRSPQSLITKYSCTACHTPDQKTVGPSFSQIANKYAGKAPYLESKIRSGGTGIWGELTMPPQTAPEGDIRIIAAWLANGMK